MPPARRRRNLADPASRLNVTLFFLSVFLSTTGTAAYATFLVLTELTVGTGLVWAMCATTCCSACTTTLLGILALTEYEELRAQRKVRAASAVPAPRAPERMLA